MDACDQLLQIPSVQAPIKVTIKKKNGNDNNSASYNKFNFKHFNNYFYREKLGNSNKKQFYKNCGFHINMLVVMLSFAGAITLFGTNWFENTVDNLIVLSNGSLIYNLWRDTTVELTYTIYVFNYTNSNEMIAGREKPKLEELGPYVFRQNFTRWKVEYNESDKVTYSENIVSVFDEEASNGTMSDRIVIPNYFVILALDKARKFNKYTQLFISSVLNSYPSFLKMTMKEFVYELDDKASILKELGSIYVLDETISLSLLKNLDGLLKDRITIGTGVRDTRKFGLIQAYNGQKVLDDWNETYCNSLTQASDGTLFPRDLIASKKRLYVYRRLICRSYPFVYERNEYTLQGYPVHRYVLAPDTFTYENNSRNRCFCREVCPIDGILDASSCFYDFPFFLSEPHFRNGDKRLLEEVQGLNPDPQKHSSYLDIHKLGVSLKINLKLQLGVFLYNSPYISHFKKVKFGQILPVGWTNVKSGNLTGTVERLVYHLTYTAPLVKTILQWALLMIFTVSLIHLILGYLYMI